MFFSSFLTFLFSGFVKRTPLDGKRSELKRNADGMEKTQMLKRNEEIPKYLDVICNRWCTFCLNALKKVQSYRQIALFQSDFGNSILDSLPQVFFMLILFDLNFPFDINCNFTWTSESCTFQRCWHYHQFRYVLPLIILIERPKKNLSRSQGITEFRKNLLFFKEFHSDVFFLFINSRLMLVQITLLVFIRHQRVSWPIHWRNVVCECERQIYKRYHLDY